LELGLEGKVAIITGGSAGLGFASACELAKEGCHVVICARNLERLLDDIPKYFLYPVLSREIDLRFFHTFIIFSTIS